MPHPPNIRFVLVAPSHPGNIGGAARAMKNMGFEDLALVTPERFPDPQAEWRAAAAGDVLERARVHPTLEDAIADCVLVAGASARRRSVPWPTRGVGDFAAEVAEVKAKGVAGPVAVVFGRESSGLSNAELQRCHLHVTIPAAAAYPSLNLAMAVQVVAYELRKALWEAPALEADDHRDRQPATAAEIAAMLAHLERALLAIGFQDPRAPRQTMTRFRRLFARTRLDETEVAMLRGVLTHVERAVAQAAGASDGARADQRNTSAASPASPSATNRR